MTERKKKGKSGEVERFWVGWGGEGRGVKGSVFRRVIVRWWWGLGGGGAGEGGEFIDV